MIIKKLALAAAVSAISFGAMAASQGGVGKSSTGEFDVTFNKGAEVRIWGLQDISFIESAVDVMQGDISESYSFCTISNNTEEVLFDVESRNGNFTLSPGIDSADAAIPYRLALANKGESVLDTWGNNSAFELPSGTQGLYRYKTKNTTNTGDSNVCTEGQQTTDLTVTIPQIEGSMPSDGAYTDTIMITIRPI